MINLTTGPVKITDEVIEALNSPVISHRSEEFKAIFKETEKQLCKQMQVQQAFILTGSGTLANDAMLTQIKASREKGIILVNGEFGNRLKQQASRLNLDFICMEMQWGEAFSTDKIEQTILMHNAKWLLACHCETSTGQMIPLDAITKICVQINVKIYLDCMSSFGTMPLNLSKMAMATASTAKAIGMVSGLALVFSNVKIMEANESPVYLDLHHYEKCNGIPFTISSNLVTGLLSASDIERQQYAWINFKENASLIFQRLKSLNIIPFANPDTLIFTLVFKDKSATDLGFELERNGIYTSFQSNYLKERNWLQIALFSTYAKAEVMLLLDLIENFIAE